MTLPLFKGTPDTMCASAFTLIDLAAMGAFKGAPDTMCASACTLIGWAAMGAGAALAEPYVCSIWMSYVCWWLEGRIGK